ncbi:glutaminyl-peptide cyclotransferase [Galbibacter pacificus]|uniref:Glutaminyl-peptide cyclotransferase n=1 Tax=Galbibacter pacificus TaxID=2996052 RepID=A0ABT6FQF9_9FLAO|nr:glutaminyl-peptide cyclotransferase [Galbibacter pacificus]MDG3582014.1 glutaminyl-peptide cyclotransferase [Galbibacter pacificus]MDG3585512.1 glutaminyl-peptide cyclotransferase [Galbibacter pacificus]
MYFYKFLIVSFLAVSVGGCNGANSSGKNLFSLKIDSNTGKIQQGSTINVDLKNRKNKEIDSVTYTLHGNPIKLNNNAYTINTDKYGIQNLEATVFFEGESVKISEDITILSDKAPKVYTYEVINTYPHDIKAYTQGLEFYNDTLYESTGNPGRNGQSSLRKVDYKSGEILKKIDLDNMYFGEGITIINNKIYMLTWQEGTGFVYDLHTFEKLSTFKYNKSKEGWGLTHTNDGKKIYKSDGSDKIWILNPETLAEEDFIETVTNTSVFNRANELEYVDGKIYANVYQKDSAMIIDPKTGAIIGVIDFRGLKEKVKQHPYLDVLNGIAYNPKTKTFFVTGKNWDRLFEVIIKEK